MKHIMKTKEEVRLFYQKMDLELERLFYKFMKILSNDEPSVVELKKIKEQLKNGRDLSGD